MENESVKRLKNIHKGRVKNAVIANKVSELWRYKTARWDAVKLQGAQVLKSPDELGLTIQLIILTLRRNSS